MVLWPPPHFSRRVQKSRQFLDLEDDASSTVCLQVSRRAGREVSKVAWASARNRWREEGCEGPVEVCEVGTHTVIRNSEMLEELPPQSALSLFGRIIKQ